jgi:hypothetical protein
MKTATGGDRVPIPGTSTYRITCNHRMHRANTVSCNNAVRVYYPNTTPSTLLLTVAYIKFMFKTMNKSPYLGPPEEVTFVVCRLI